MLLGVSAPPSVSRAKSASSAKMRKLPQCLAILKEMRWSTESDELLAALIIVKSRNWKMIASQMNSVFLHPAHMWFSMADCSRRWKTLRRKLKEGITDAHGMSLEFKETGFDHVLGVPNWRVKRAHTCRPSGRVGRMVRRAYRYHGLHLDQAFHGVLDEPVCEACIDPSCFSLYN